MPAEKVEARRTSSLRTKLVVGSLAVSAATAGLLAPGLLKNNKSYTRESNQQIERSLDSDWTLLARRMIAIAKDTRNSKLIVQKKSADVTGGTGIGANTTTLTIQGGQMNSYGFKAVLIEPTKTMKLESAQPGSSFSINFQGGSPISAPFTEEVNASTTVSSPASVYFSIEKTYSDQWTFDAESSIAEPGFTRPPEKSSGPINSAIEGTLIKELSMDIGFFLTQSNLQSEFSGSPLFES